MLRNSLPLSSNYSDTKEIILDLISSHHSTQERMTPTEPTHGDPDPLDPTHGDLTKLTQYSLPSIQETKLMEPMLP